VLTGISAYVNVAALVCAFIALPLFIGAKRRSLFDKNNLFGLVLLGLATLLHGGFQTLLRSSPHAVFSGYILGWDGGSEGRESSLWIYDLGFPPVDTGSSYNAPYRNLILTTNRNNLVPASFWNTDSHEYLKCDYRIWDQEITRIDAVPVPNAKQSVSAAWRWESQSEGRIWTFLEALLGFLVACKCILLLGRKEPTGELSSDPAARRFPNKWAARIYIATVSIILAWIVFVRLSDRFFQHQAQVLLEDIQHLELRKSTWQDAEQIRKDYGKHSETFAACAPVRCDFTVTLNHWPPLMFSSRFGPIAWTAWSLPGGRWARIDATVSVRDGVVWGKHFTAEISHREGYALIARAQTVRNFGLGLRYPQNPHPNIGFGRPGGCEICQALWAKVTPFASAYEIRDAFAFDLSCVGATLRRCTTMSQIMPVAARRMEDDSRSIDSETPPALASLPAMIRAYGRDAETAAIARVVRIRHERSSDTHERIDFVEYRLVEPLKGTLANPVLHETFYPKATSEVPPLGERVIVFGSGGGNAEAFVPLTDSNLQEVQAGIAEGAVDIPGSR
jgi:hypothetical protein